MGFVLWKLYFSAVLREKIIIIQQALFKYKFPFADGYKGFWMNPISIQHPLATMELVVWDGAIILVISEDDKIVESIIRKDNQIEDLEAYNSRK